MIDVHVHGGAGGSRVLPSSLGLSSKAVVVSENEHQEGQTAPMGRHWGRTAPGAVVTSAGGLMGTACGD